MLAALATLLVCQLAGEAIVRALALPLPGPVIGMALLFIVMLARAPLSKELGPTADTLLRHLSLLFVPAGVGVVQNLSTLGREGAQLISVVVLATVITLAVTALTFEYLARFMGVDETDAEQQAGEQ
jgi:holin-like protein